MNAFFFGTSERRLFGIYEPAHATVTGVQAAVLCQPWGPEYIYAHRSMRQLARMLNAAGVHTLRFDYYGTGDFGGDSRDLSMDGYRADIVAAVEELQEITGVQRVALIGLRLGASLAAAVAANLSDDVAALVLWDPVVSGDEYLQQLYRDAETGIRPEKGLAPISEGLGGGYEVLGFPLASSLAADFRRIDLASLASGFPNRTLIVISEALPSHPRLKEVVGGTSAQVIEILPGIPIWLWLDVHWFGEARLTPGMLPVKVLQRITEWCQQEALANRS